MADDIKTLAKKNTDLEKRLKVAEAKIKVLTDSITSAKDIDKILEIHQKKMMKEQDVTYKDTVREIELSNKLHEAGQKERDKEYAKITKDFEKMSKTAAQAAELNILKTRLTVVENLVQAALKK